MRPRLAGSTILAYASLGFMAAIFVHDILGPRPAVSSAPRPERPEWQPILRAHAAFALDFPPLSGIETRYQVRRHRDGGRKDELQWGSAAGPAPYVRVSLYRRAPLSSFADPFDAVVEEVSAERLDADLTGPTGELLTKFGALAVVDMVVRHADGERQCAAVARGWSDPRFGLVAWWCNSGRELVAHGDLACLLDRLTLMSAGGDARLAEMFAAAELKRGFCKGRRMLDPGWRRPRDWIEARSQPKLRGSIAAR